MLFSAASVALSPPFLFGDCIIDTFVSFLIGLTARATDVTMIAWSPDGTRIASSSIDNEVIVWVLAGGAPRLLKRLHGHSGLVKGVAFDPIGKYLASQVRVDCAYPTHIHTNVHTHTPTGIWRDCCTCSQFRNIIDLLPARAHTQGEDSVVIVWRTSDWEREATIDEGKRSAVGAGSFFTRLSWSPDGKVLAIPRVLFNGRVRPAQRAKFLCVKSVGVCFVWVVVSFLYFCC